ncbi:nuclear transport factor 2 family protein [uncultured Croceitalea sp.]|uniref:nuclear transport factor 2 family protein n=1 Tax=uncultured Croceitalea sp. TaxID=1798908 RepID=UPI0033064E1E
MKFIVALLITTSLYAQTDSSTEYYRHLRYNHVSPCADVVGIHPIDRITAQSTSHYIFRINKSGKPVEIINNHYHTEKKHPLASIGAYKTRIIYSDSKEIRTFYDPSGKQIANDRGVYKEVYFLDSKKFKYKLQFFDLHDNPMESNWKISKYIWNKKGKLIIEKRYNLLSEEVNVSPYFKFGITGILLDREGVPKVHYNLDDKLKKTNNAEGIASYQDVFDSQGNHIKFSYHDKNGDLAETPRGFAIAEKIYDDIGNQIGLKRYDINKNLILDFPVFSNSKKPIEPSATQKDSLEIRDRALGYLIALQQLKPDLMNEVMNDSLNKVTIGYDRGAKQEYARRTTRNQMIEFANSWNKANNKFPPKPSNDAKILDIYNRIANVKLVSDNWVEYLHLIKLDGNWQIINLIWQHRDISRYPKE